MALLKIALFIENNILYMQIFQNVFQVSILIHLLGLLQEKMLLKCKTAN